MSRIRVIDLHKEKYWKRKQTVANQFVNKILAFNSE